MRRVKIFRQTLHLKLKSLILQLPPIIEIIEMSTYSSNYSIPYVELSEKVREAYEKFCETARHAEEVTAAATELALSDLNEVVKVFAEETGRVKNEISGFKDLILRGFCSSLLFCSFFGFVLYGLYFARKAH